MTNIWYCCQKSKLGKSIEHPHLKSIGGERFLTLLFSWECRRIASIFTESCYFLEGYQLLVHLLRDLVWWTSKYLGSGFQGLLNAASPVAGDKMRPDDHTCSSVVLSVVFTTVNLEACSIFRHQLCKETRWLLVVLSARIAIAWIEFWKSHSCHSRILKPMVRSNWLYFIKKKKKNSVMSIL